MLRSSTALVLLLLSSQALATSWQASSESKAPAFSQLGKRERVRSHPPPPPVLASDDAVGLLRVPIAKNHSEEPSALTGELRLNGVPLTEYDAEATCGDGSSAVFYARKGYNTALWLVWLGGGPSCYDAASCGGIPAAFTSSSKSTHSIFLSGIFSTSSLSKTLQFSDANVVWVPYCSADQWLGDVAGNQTEATMGSPPLFPGGFRGARIVRTVIDVLVAKSGLGTAPSTRLLFGGCTPGAISNLDAVAAQLPGVSVQGLFDSAMLVDQQPLLVPGLLSLANLTEQVFENVNGSALVAPACAATYPSQLWRCAFGQYSLPFVQTPYLLAQAQFDRAQLSYNDPRPGTTNASLAYADGFQAAVSGVLASLPTAAQSHSAVFSSACFTYCTSLTAQFWNSAVQRSSQAAPAQAGPAAMTALRARRAAQKQPPISLDGALTLWFFKNERGVRVVEECDGWRCGKCHATVTRQETAAERAATSHSYLVGPILVGTFITIVLVGCCLACAASGAGRRRGLMGLASGAGEATPLMASTQMASSSSFQGVMPRSALPPKTAE